MFRIRIGFNVDPDPDPAFHIKADPDPALPSQNVDFDMKNVLYVVIIRESIPT